MIDISHPPLGKLDNGDEAEEAVVDVIQKTGKLLLEEWSQKKSDQAAEEVQNQAGHHLHGKKVQWYTSLGAIEVQEQCFRTKKKRLFAGRRIKPFEKMTGVKSRGYSRRCQKLMTDFGVEESFQLASLRMKEHHDVEINVSAI